MKKSTSIRLKRIGFCCYFSVFFMCFFCNFLGIYTNCRTIGLDWICFDTNCANAPRTALICISKKSWNTSVTFDVFWSSVPNHSSSKTNFYRRHHSTNWINGHSSFSGQTRHAMKLGKMIKTKYLCVDIRCVVCSNQLWCFYLDDQTSRLQVRVDGLFTWM